MIPKDKNPTRMTVAKLHAYCYTRFEALKLQDGASQSLRSLEGQACRARFHAAIGRHAEDYRLHDRKLSRHTIYIVLLTLGVIYLAVFK